MTRSVEDAMLVLQAINGPDAGDPSSVPSHLDVDATAPVAGLKVGYIGQWMTEPPVTDAAFLRRRGAEAFTSRHAACNRSLNASRPIRDSRTMTTG
jgi:Asp-tRNA(Asn)/Glu-tRNA(Gln) amidotransferase A subunit family amidase